MKNLQRLCAAVALAFAVTLPVLAGDISTGPGAAPLPPPPSSAVETGGTANETALSSFAEIGLSLLQSVLSLF